MEIWKDIEGYEGFYEVSDRGSVRNVRSGRVLAIGYSKASHYPCVVLSKNGQKKCCSVHRLVAKAFIPNPDNLPEVNHRNEVRDDNRVENLEWCTRLYNIRYGTGIERRALSTRNDHRSKAVRQFDLKGNFVREYESMHEMNRQTGYSRKFIKVCIDGKRPTAYGYKWQYAISK